MYDRSTVITVSTLRTFERCPLAYQIGVMDGAPAATTEAMERGTRVHALIARFLSGDVPTADEINDIADLWAAFTRFLSACPPGFAGNGMDVETPIVMGDLAGTPDVIFRAADGSIAIVDWKTGYEIVGPVWGDDQLRLYQHLADLDDAPVTLVRVYLAHDLAQTHESNAIEQAAWFAGFDRRADRLRRACEKNDFPARAGGHCGSCLWRRFCPVYSEALVSLQDVSALPMDANTVAHLARAVRVAEARIRDAKEAIRSYIAGNGPVEIDGERLALTVSHTTTVDTAAAVGVLLKAGYEPASVLGTLAATKGRLEKLTTGDPATKAALAERAYRRTETTELRWEKVK